MHYYWPCSTGFSEKFHIIFSSLVRISLPCYQRFTDISLTGPDKLRGELSNTANWSKFTEYSSHPIGLLRKMEDEKLTNAVQKHA
jgi:hypothetical protein